MEPVITVLARRMRELEEELQKILRMAQSLRRIEQRYRDMENVILDGLELPAGGQQPGNKLKLPPIQPPDLSKIFDDSTVIKDPPDWNRKPRTDPELMGKFRKFLEEMAQNWWKERFKPGIIMNSDLFNIPRHVYRDISISPLWVTPEGRDGSRWCCPVVHLSVAHAEPEEVVGNNGMAVRLASLPAADN